ncbi:YoaK family protein [Limnoglobus roseus]|uniref:DUF1275 domain-containing protein n=1 Tax=Limnoglobus roseus TaxID=2598579 RepID=A0A5C1AHX1_9BACT|nr:YoaK family protein [Limnoglobus roseus]QEL17596.1 hypothetical protein PX52LOC_04592 [Limnoglobus roseus]
MMTKLPRWVEVGGFGLAAVAGAANAVGLLGFRHQAVSHVTGTATLVGLAVADGDGAAAARLAPALLAFVLGAAASGAIVGHAALRLDRRYAVALLAESALFVAAMVLLTAGSTAGHVLASAACGLQNGLVSTYSGAVVRTTHVTGLLTDLGTMIGHRVRGRPFDRRRAVLYLVLISGFVLGGAVGAVSYRDLRFAAPAVPAAGAAGLAAACWAYVGRTPATTEAGPSSQP